MSSDGMDAKRSATEGDGTTAKRVKVEEEEEKIKAETDDLIKQETDDEDSNTIKEETDDEDSDPIKEETDDEDSDPIKEETDDEVAQEPIMVCGPMYDEATARKMLKEVVSTSFNEEGDGPTVVGFDPDDAALDNLYLVHEEWPDNFRDHGTKLTPLIYFAERGNAKMCRYLISRGVSTTKSSVAALTLTNDSEEGLSPMYVAATGGHLDICKALHANGAQNNLWKDDGHGDTPFHTAACEERDEVLRWMTLHGALCADDNSENVEVDRIYPKASHMRVSESHPILERLNRPISRSCQRLIAWAQEMSQTHFSLVTFLGGALPPAPGTTQSRILQCLSIHPDIRRHIADFVGLEVTKRKHLRILRSVVDVLPRRVEAELANLAALRQRWHI